jgi:transcriptional regulator GlxA family with amidase domain
VRVERARWLLALGASTEQVAIELDYSDARSLRRAFEQWTGESAGQLPPPPVNGALSCAAA